MAIIQAIGDDILYLRHKANLHVTLHPMVAEPLIAPTALLRFNIHESPYCIDLKAQQMEDARNLLADSTLDIAEIACAVGFEDRNYFTLRFRKAAGCSPRAYRQNTKTAPP